MLHSLISQIIIEVQVDHGDVFFGVHAEFDAFMRLINNPILLQRLVHIKHFSESLPGIRGGVYVIF
jgi:hypothetical protein